MFTSLEISIILKMKCIMKARAIISIMEDRTNIIKSMEICRIHMEATTVVDAHTVIGMMMATVVATMVVKVSSTKIIKITWKANVVNVLRKGLMVQKVQVSVVS